MQHTREELNRMKRQKNIEDKEREVEMKRKEAAEQKREELERLKTEFEEQEKRRVEERILFLHTQAAARAKKKATREELNAKRERNIEKRYAKWREQADAVIAEKLDQQRNEDEEVRLALEQARERKNQKEQEVRDKKAEQQAMHEELESARAEQLSQKAQKRELNSIYKVDQLKTEATEELESFILSPYPVPLKQVLAGRMRPVPTVTELLAAYKDQKEELKELEEMDIPTRAMLRNQTLFQYVRDIQLKAEHDRVRPPEPQQADLGRSRNRASHPRRASPSPKGAKRSTLGASR